jgi:medium-chain acyl-[acyl-carrier-protein] hydrolase
MRPRLARPARLRVFCFPYAGGTAGAYRSWFQGFGPDIEVCAVQLPARGARFKEPAHRSLSTLLPELTTALAPLLDRPFVFFGHSMGALVAFELARELRRRDLAGPSLLIASAHHAPHRPDPDPPLSPLSDEEFIAELRARYDGIPQEVLSEPELLALLLPVLRADVEILESYRYGAEGPLACPIVCCGGEDDPHTRRDELEAWREQTRADFRLRLFPGGHFYLADARAALLESLRGDVEVACAVA